CSLAAHPTSVLLPHPEIPHPHSCKRLESRWAAASRSNRSPSRQPAPRENRIDDQTRARTPATLSTPPSSLLVQCRLPASAQRSFSRGFPWPQILAALRRAG